jgi:hypothetical protein
LIIYVLYLLFQVSTLDFIYYIWNVNLLIYIYLLVENS